MQRELHWEERLKSEPLPCESPASLVARSNEADEDSAEAPVDLADDDFPAAAVALAAGLGRPQLGRRERPSSSRIIER